MKQKVIGSRRLLRLLSENVELCYFDESTCEMDYGSKRLKMWQPKSHSLPFLRPHSDARDGNFYTIPIHFAISNGALKDGSYGEVNKKIDRVNFAKYLENLHERRVNKDKILYIAMDNAK